MKYMDKRLQWLFATQLIFFKTKNCNIRSLTYSLFYCQLPVWSCVIHESPKSTNRIYQVICYILEGFHSFNFINFFFSCRSPGVLVLSSQKWLFIADISGSHSPCCLHVSGTNLFSPTHSPITLKSKSKASSTKKSQSFKSFKNYHALSKKIKIHWGFCQCTRMFLLERNLFDGVICKVHFLG